MYSTGETKCSLVLLLDAPPKLKVKRDSEPELVSEHSNHISFFSNSLVGAIFHGNLEKNFKEEDIRGRYLTRRQCAIPRRSSLSLIEEFE